MTKNFLVIFFFLLFALCLKAQTIFGNWNTINEATGEVIAVIEVYEKNGKAYAKVIEIKDPKRKNSLCELCPDEHKNKPILGLTILTDLEKNINEWSGGKILDPRSGKVYKCYIKLVNENKLKIRGYIGFSFLGKTTYWKSAYEYIK